MFTNLLKTYRLSRLLNQHVWFHHRLDINLCFPIVNPMKEVVPEINLHHLIHQLHLCRNHPQFSTFLLRQQKRCHFHRRCLKQQQTTCHHRSHKPICMTILHQKNHLLPHSNPNLITSLQQLQTMFPKDQLYHIDEALTRQLERTRLLPCIPQKPHRLRLPRDVAKIENSPNDPTMPLQTPNQFLFQKRVKTKLYKIPRSKLYKRNRPGSPLRAEASSSRNRPSAETGLRLAGPFKP